MKRFVLATLVAAALMASSGVAQAHGWGRGHCGPRGYRGGYYAGYRWAGYPRYGYGYGYGYPAYGYYGYQPGFSFWIGR